MPILVEQSDGSLVRYATKGDDMIHTDPETNEPLAESTDPIPFTGSPFLISGDWGDLLVPIDMGEQPPRHEYLGLAVHYVARGSLDGVFPPVDRACIIAALNVDGDPWRITGVVLNPRGIFFDDLNHNGEWGEPGTWHYPWENLPDDSGTDEDGDSDDDPFELGVADSPLG